MGHWSTLNLPWKTTSFLWHLQISLEVSGTFYSHNCYIYITIQTIQIHIAATNYMTMFNLFLENQKKNCKKIIV